MERTQPTLATPAELTYQFVNPTELPPIPPDRLAAIGSGDGVSFEADNADRWYCRYGATFLDDPDEVGLFTPEHVGSCGYRYPAAFTAAVDHARLVGYRTLLTPCGQFFTDEAYAEPPVFRKYLNRLSQPDGFSNEETGLTPGGQPGCFYFAGGARAVRHVAGAATVLCSDEPLSYGSFLFRVLPKVWAIRKLGLTELPCIVYAQQGAYRDLLTLAGLPEKSILLHQMNVMTDIDRAIVPCLRNTHGYLDPQTCELLAEMRAAYSSGSRGRRIYVSRMSLNQEGWSTRVMINEEELIRRLAAVGFDIITPEHLSIREQIAVFAGAALVVGPSGSNLYNTMFCHPGTKLIDLQSEKHWIYSYAGMYASLGLNYGIFVGKADPADTKSVHRHWSVNIEALLARIRTFSEQ
jgi:hypothetical protein